MPDTLPPYTVRASSRARRISLKVSARDGLVVVLPRGARDADAVAAVRSRLEWATDALARVAPRRALVVAGPEAWLPSEVYLAAFGERWPVEYRHTQACGVRARLDGGALRLSGDVDDAAACVKALSRWLHAVARDRLPGMLAELASEHGYTFAAGSVRLQRSRWGSCSHARRISLNRTLVFLPEHLVRYVMLHELVHTRRLDHSAGFWAELFALMPDATALRAELRQSGSCVPVWAEADAPLDAR